MLNVLIYRVPIEAEITEAWIETVRKHCRMKPERLAELRAGPHARHWPRMLERRAARMTYFKEHGELPPRWAGPLPGESDHVAQLGGARRYRKDGLAKMKARLRKRPDTTGEKLRNRYLATNRKSAALDDITARLAAQVGTQAGKLKLREYNALKRVMLPDNALPRQFRKKPPAGMRFDADADGQRAGMEAGPEVPSTPRTNRPARDRHDHHPVTHTQSAVG
jgi:hypothetical protein